MAFTFPKVSNKFVPRTGQTYRFIGVPSSKHGNISLLIGRRVWKGNDADKQRMAVNNVFATVQEAKDVRSKIVAALTGAQRTSRYGF
jgi:hypothetical protein